MNTMELIFKHGSLMVEQAILPVLLERDLNFDDEYYSVLIDCGQVV